jgi:N-acetylmuramoyl-L-alanine amidase
MGNKYIVEPGDCLSSIARKFGFVNWRIIWDSPDNATLKKRHPNPDVISPGDEITIPDKKPKSVSVGKGASASTSLKQEKVFLRLGVFIDPDKKSPKGRYELSVEGVEFPFKGDLPGDGQISAEVPVKAKKGKLLLYLTGGDEPEEEIDLTLGHLDPARTVSGAQERLRRLGYDCGAVDGILGVRTRSALLAFQDVNSLDATGALDQPTVNKLVDLFEGGGAYPKADPPPKPAAAGQQADAADAPAGDEAPADEPAEEREKEPYKKTSTKDNQIDIVFEPDKSAKVTTCNRIVHVQFNRRVADDKVVKPSEFSSAFRFKDEIATAAGWTVDCLQTETTPDYQQGVGDGKKNGGTVSATMSDVPTTAGGDRGFFDSAKNPGGIKKYVLRFATFAYCMDGPDCGKWYEGITWEFTKTWEDQRDGKAGVSAVTATDVSAPSAEHLDAFTLFNTKKNFVPCKK